LRCFLIQSDVTTKLEWIKSSFLFYLVMRVFLPENFFQKESSLLLKSIAWDNIFLTWKLTKCSFILVIMVWW
jgi:hypothetical protein